jgi:diguanylate cyclase (GGDEF)-like protein
LLQKARRQGAEVVVLFIDLDLFKPVNDRFGHEFGDRLLVEVARRLEQLFRSEDTVARLGGDEFVVLMPAVTGKELAAQAARKVVERLSEPFDIDGQAVSISASVGVALFPQDADSPAALIAGADAAMYRAKNAGRATWRS